MSVKLLWLVSDLGFLHSSRDGNRSLASSKFVSPDTNLLFQYRANMDKIQKWNPDFCSFRTDLRYPCIGNSGLQSLSSTAPLVSSMIATSSAGEMAVSSEEKVYNVVLKQAALVKRQLRPSEDLDVKPDIVAPGTLSLLIEAYDRCGEVCAEYAKTFYLG